MPLIVHLFTSLLELHTLKIRDVISLVCFVAYLYNISYYLTFQVPLLHCTEVHADSGFDTGSFVDETLPFSQSGDITSHRDKNVGQLEFDLHDLIPDDLEFIDCDEKTPQSKSSENLKCKNSPEKQADNPNAKIIEETSVMEKSSEASEACDDQVDGDDDVNSHSKDDKRCLNECKEKPSNIADRKCFKKKLSIGEKQSKFSDADPNSASATHMELGVESPSTRISQSLSISRAFSSGSLGSASSEIEHEQEKNEFQDEMIASVIESDRKHDDDDDDDTEKGRDNTERSGNVLEEPGSLELELRLAEHSQLTHEVPFSFMSFYCTQYSAFIL